MSGACPHPEKAGYSSRGKAWAAVRGIRQNHPERDKLPRRAYRCDCGRWHLASEVDT